MPEYAQLILPGMPVRLVVSALWEDSTRPATIRATYDVPSDQYSSQLAGFDCEGKFTISELADAMCTYVYAMMDELRQNLALPEDE